MTYPVHNESVILNKKIPSSSLFAFYEVIANLFYHCIWNFWQRHVVDFYISDFQSGLRALVKTGYGARVMPYVDESIVVDINPNNKDMSPEFLRWLAERNLSSDDRVMRMKEG